MNKSIEDLEDIIQDAILYCVENKNSKDEISNVKKLIEILQGRRKYYGKQNYFSKKY